MTEPRSNWKLDAPWVAADLYEAIGDRVACFDASGTLRQCNAAYAHAIGRGVDDVLGWSLAELAEAAPRLLIHTLARQARSGRPVASAIEFDEHLARWVITRVLSVHDGLLVVSADADEELVRQHQIARQVTLDEQTGLPNRMALTEELARVQAPVELLSIEVEHVARVAEALGQ
ncbi:MAG: PAS domain-containing protein, partial [Rubrivivax sp.]